MRRVVVGDVSEIPPGSRKIVDVDGRSFGVFNVAGSFYAIRNRCPHQGGPVCLGRVGGTFMSSEPQELVYGMDKKVISCPWHHWEFDLENGESLCDPKVRVKRLEVSQIDDQLVLHV